MMTDLSQIQSISRGFLSQGVGHSLRPLLSGWLIAAILLLVLAVFGALTYVVWRYERSETQVEYDVELKRVAANLRGQLIADLRTLQVPGAIEDARGRLAPVVFALATNKPSILMVELHQQNSTQQKPVVERLFARSGSDVAALISPPVSVESLSAAQLSRRKLEVSFSASVFLPIPNRQGQEVVDAWIPLQAEANPAEVAVVRVVFSLSGLLADWLPRDFAQRNELSLRETDGTVLAWGPGLNRGAGEFRSTAILDLIGNPLVLHGNSEKTGPRLIPNALYGLVFLLGMTLLASLYLLVRDIRGRLLAERRLREALSFRTAMESSLSTGLRARDLDGKITYVNQAFCDMVGFSADEIIGLAPPMPYWAPEGRQEYERRHAQVVAGTITNEGFDIIFMHKSGRRFPALVYEAPLIDENGKQSGWMGSIVDVTKQRQIEQLNLQQQQQLERASRLSTMGELASVLSHELNQPLSAISSYATGADNLIAAQSTKQPELHMAIKTIQHQAQRAGAIIHRMQDFVRKRDIQSELVDFAATVKSLESLILLQARSCSARLVFSWPRQPVWVQADKVLLEQVVLNLTRNAVESVAKMPTNNRLVYLKVQQRGSPAAAVLTVEDSGPGVDPMVLPQLFTMYVTTKDEGMGIGLNICRSVAERFGGQLNHQSSAKGGASFEFSLPLAQSGS